MNLSTLDNLYHKDKKVINAPIRSLRTAMSKRPIRFKDVNFDIKKRSKIYSNIKYRNLLGMKLLTLLINLEISGSKVSKIL